MAVFQVCQRGEGIGLVTIDVDDVDDVGEERYREWFDMCASTGVFDFEAIGFDFEAWF